MGADEMFRLAWQHLPFTPGGPVVPANLQAWLEVRQGCPLPSRGQHSATGCAWSNGGGEDGSGFGGVLKRLVPAAASQAEASDVGYAAPSL